MASNRNSSFFLKSFSSFSYILVGILSFVTIVGSSLLFMTFQSMHQKEKIQINQVLTSDIIAENEMRYVDEEASSRNEEIIRMTTAPFYIKDAQVIKKRLDSIDQLLKSAGTHSYEQIQNIFQNSDISLGSTEFNLLKKITQTHPNFSQIIYAVCNEYYNRGIVEVANYEVTRYEVSGIILIEKNDESNIESFLTIQELQAFRLTASMISQLVRQRFASVSEIDRRIIENMLTNFLKPTIQKDEELTEKELTQKINTQRNVYKKIIKGQIVARKGDIVTEENYPKILAATQSTGNFFSYHKFISTFIIISLLILFAYFLIREYEPDFFKVHKNFVFISIMTLLYIVYCAIPISFVGDGTVSGIYVPIAALSITLLFLYTKIIALLCTVILSILFILITGDTAMGFIFVILSGLISVLTLKSLISKRTDLLLAGIYIAAHNFVIAGVIAFFYYGDIKNITVSAVYGAINGMLSGVLCVGFIAIGELFLNTPTVFRLQELTDTSSPLLRRLFDSAIGTYTHSINVANLAEAAANEINASGLLARVGGLYHDIGKTKNAEHFIENQGKKNIHETMNPFVSMNIIRSHVNIGVEEAKKAKLPQKVIDIIGQHHGKTVIKFFYSRAIQENKTDQPINKEDFQYKSDNPSFPESAVVMLADQVEAVSRVLQEYSEETITLMVNGIVDEKFRDGILDSSGLTFNDVTSIKKVFIRTLTGMYHSRIQYPDIEEDKNEIATP